MYIYTYTYISICFNPPDLYRGTRARAASFAYIIPLVHNLLIQSIHMSHMIRFFFSCMLPDDMGHNPQPYTATSKPYRATPAPQVPMPNP